MSVTGVCVCVENRELVQSKIMINLARYDNDTVSAREERARVSRFSI